MRRVFVLTVVVAMSLFALPLVGSAGPPTVSITGGGISLNVDAGEGAVAIGGFNAKILGNGSVQGQFQAKTVDADGTLLSQLHGVVTCVELDGGIWEIRIHVTKASGGAEPLLGLNGSIFVQDDPDMVDESFNLGQFGTSDCVGTCSATMEDMVHGNIKVRGN